MAPQAPSPVLPVCRGTRGHTQHSLPWGMGCCCSKDEDEPGGGAQGTGDEDIEEEENPLGLRQVWET